MSKPGEILLTVTQWLIFIAVVGWILWRWLKKSDDPPRLIAKWAVSAVMIAITGWVAATNYKEGGGWGAAFIIAITCAICGIVLGITWGTNIAHFVARPLTGLFDGGSEEIAPQPFYSIAVARRKQGKYADAIAEVRKQLAKFPGDFQGTMLLAEIQVENFDDLPGAQTTVERLLAEGTRTAGDTAAALNQLADWHLKYGQDPASAAAALQRIIDTFPDTEPAHMAAQRLAHLSTPEMLAEKREPHRIKLGQYQDNIGLLTEPAQVRPPSEDPVARARDLVNHLKDHPNDNEARENLAVIYARHYGRLDLAADQLEELLAQPHAPARDAVHWLNLLADLHVQEAGNVEAARDALQRIADRFPNSAAGQGARTRMAHLNLELRAKQKSQVVPLGSYEKDPGLRERPSG